MIKTFKKFFTVLSVLFLAFIVSAFLFISCKLLKTDKSEKESKETKQVDEKTKQVDEKETKEGQPIKRNLLE